MKYILEKSIKIAIDAHLGQKDKSGEPYIFHLLRVMNSVETNEEKIVAILHDVVEDTHLDFDNLIDLGIPKNLVMNLKLLTRNNEIDYEGYIKRIAKSPLAAKVKLADLKDNMDASRLKKISERDIERLNKYIVNYNYLKSVK